MRRGRLQKIKTGPSGSPTQWQDLTYTYDGVGNVLTIADAKVAGGTQTQTFGYDHLDRLLTANAAGGSAGQGQYSESYSYNLIGNMTSKSGVSYTYPPSGDVSERPHAVRRVTGSGGTAKTVQIRAYSTPCNDGVRATMELWVNGVKQQTWSNVAGAWTTYQQSVVLSGNDQIEVVFTNDCSAGGYDRNLYVDYVVVDGGCNVVTSTQRPSSAGAIGQATGSVVSSTRTAQAKGRLTGGRPGGWTTQNRSSWPTNRVRRSTLTIWPAKGWQARMTRTYRTDCDAWEASCKPRPTSLHRPQWI